MRQGSFSMPPSRTPGYYRSSLTPFSWNLAACHPVSRQFWYDWVWILALSLTAKRTYTRYNNTLSFSFLICKMLSLVPPRIIKGPNGTRYPKVPGGSGPWQVLKSSFILAGSCWLSIAFSPFLPHGLGGDQCPPLWTPSATAEQCPYL